MSTLQNKLIVALDVETRDKALELVEALRGTAGMFKIGSQLFTASGPQLVREIVKRDERVFLDLKFHDIPNTVAAAGVEATRLGVSMFNVHASGGGTMMRRTADAVSECAAREGVRRPIVLGVTILTSSDRSTLQEIGSHEQPATAVERLARLAATNGMDGVVASAHEVALIRNAISKSPFVIVTPGVRPNNAANDDQNRVMTPRHAIDAGADYIVVGRPILQAHDPVVAAREILAEMERRFAVNGA
ncbi:MAG TPA: orotidine-5'-phosphate decarboxylase [Pyrinomonadaceae bacterium]|nr:orotidine-5'-phosphate decarboxylase [Pyrinomonadaceae bacterium]